MDFAFSEKKRNFASMIVETNIAYFTYTVLYVVTMTLIFALSALMLVPRFKVIFKCPVPSIHNTIGICLIIWGMSYLLFLPDFYLAINGIYWRNHAYIVISMFSIIMCMATLVWSLTSFFQQGIRQSVIQPIVHFLPSSIMLWYAFSPQEWLLRAFPVVCGVQGVVLIAYIVHLYKSYVADIKVNYSSLSLKMIHSLWIQMGATVFVYTFFFIAVVQDSVTWNIVNIISNLFSLFLFVYNSEHLMPLPEKDVAENGMQESVIDDGESSILDIGSVLAEKCEKDLLFCNPDLSLQDLALAVGTNRTYLSKWFITNNTTFYNYINHLRITYAAHLLLTTDEPVTQIQSQSGFISKSTFRKYFIECFQCTPSDYRKSREA